MDDVQGTQDRDKQAHGLHSLADADAMMAEVSRAGIDLVGLALDFAATPPESSAVLFTGSLNEHMGSRYSDVDLLVLTEDHGESSPDGNGSVSLHTGDLRERLLYPDPYEVHVAVLPYASISHVAREFELALPAMADPTQLGSYPVLNYADIKLLHRIRTGHVLHGAELVDVWRTRLLSDLLPVYLAAFIYVYTLEHVEKLRGLADERRRPETIWQTHHRWAEECMGSALAACGVTNPSRRWLYELVEQVPAGPGREFLESVCRSSFAYSDEADVSWAIDDAIVKTQGLRALLCDNPLLAPLIEEIDGRIRYGSQ